ncbi:hypothetical protein EDI_237820 [Entamoeba dispar SAW760]|uniref:Uncharacterized protein n=1 Tax=Entamoeba dispar (strain ATCC PRA-260 / SAW760) TaxID=370354 RepID=B0E894_ENTDS|nr:uncharacterized protein EDI_237820 [Entamoeba dispar SAW760]EDR29219.1 hypothetical protein EDI_237820 [Entamoeba dispar SAW760]|eukprot:EDR29219.1 hypothetical protein EDI_237820 [Entamoeba dispar SAW760]
MSNTKEQRIQDISLLVSDSNSNRDLVETTNIKLIEPFFEALFSLDDTEYWLKEQAVISLNRLMKTHRVDKNSGVIRESSMFYGHLEGYIEEIKKIITETKKSDKKEALAQKYIIQIWSEAVGWIVHSHQYNIIKTLYEKGVLEAVIKKMTLEEYKESTIIIKAGTRIIIELISMELKEIVIGIIEKSGIMEFIKKKIEEKNQEFKTFCNEIIFKMQENKEYENILEEVGLNREDIIKEVNECHEEINKVLMEASETTGEIEEEIEEEDYGYEEEEDNEENEEEDDDMTAQMEDFFEEIKNKPEMLEEMEIDSSIPDMKDEPLMPKDLPVFSKKFEHLYDEINRQDNLFV